MSNENKNLLLNLDIGSYYKIKHDFSVFKLEHSEDEIKRNWKTRREDVIKTVRGIYVGDVVVYLGYLKIPADKQDLDNIVLINDNNFWEDKGENSVVLYRFLYKNEIFYNHEFHFYQIIFESLTNTNYFFNKNGIETVIFEEINDQAFAKQ